MAEFTDTLTDKHIVFIEKQPVYFTATAASDGRINLSPKGYAVFMVAAGQYCRRMMNGARLRRISP